MERNWLIRTSQNQILGPVAKQKLLEFIQKGALGLTDEVTSGNGYWFALKERDLVEKYLHGDIPQGYNPISESKSVLSKRENPDKTTSINNAPANKTPVVKETPGVGIAPKSEDLEFPDVDLTIVGKTPALNLLKQEAETKLPAADDLEFPDITTISSSVNVAFKAPVNQVENSRPAPAATPVAVVVKELASTPLEEVVLPNEDDLAFPDMNDYQTSPKVEKGKVDLSHQYTRTVALDTEQVSENIPESKTSGAKQMKELDGPSDDIHFSLTLDVPSKPEPANPEKVASTEVRPVIKKERQQQAPEERKLLHDRKPKGSVKPAALRDPTREVVHKEREGQPEALKKRNDNYIFFILIILILIIVSIFFYFKEILNKPLPV